MIIVTPNDDLRQEIASASTIIENIPLDGIDASFGNDRTRFSPESLQALADSSRARRDLMPPIIVRRRDDGRFQLIAGERRTRSGRILQAEGALFVAFCAWFGLGAFVNPFTHIRAEIREMSDEDAAALMLAENSSREDLDPIDQAAAFQRRMTDYGWDVATVAERAGVSITNVTNRLKLLRLREEIQFLIRTGNMPIKYGEVIGSADLDRNRQMIALRRLQECPAPTYDWLRRVCCDLAEAQDQTDLFGDTLFVDFSATITKQECTSKAPAHPYKDRAPIVGSTPAEVISGQIAFWTKAADDWDRYGKRPLRQACEAIVVTLRPLLAVVADAESGVR